MTGNRLLIVEDDPLTAKDITLRLESQGYQIVACVDSGEKALDSCRSLAPDLVLMDIVLAGGMDGIEAAGLIKDSHAIPVIYLTAHADDGFLRRARITEPYGYILKPYTSRELHAAVSMALFRAEAECQRKELAQLAATLASLSEALVVADQQERIVRVNQAAQALLQRPADQLLGKSLVSSLPLFIGAQPCARALVDQLHRQQSPLSSEERVELCLDEQEPLPVSVRLSLFRGAADSEPGTLVLMRDVHERRQMEAELRLHAKVFESAREGIIITDADTRILKVNQALCEQTGYSAEELLGLSPKVLQSGLQDSAFYRGLWAELQRSGSWHGEIWDKRKNGDIYPVLLNISAVRTVEGKVSHYIGIHTDISVSPGMQEQLYRMAHYDALTALPNRLLFHRQLLTQLNRFHAEGRKFELWVLDLIGFGRINESAGHAAGDLLLKTAADRLRALLPEHTLLARIGSDSFGVCALSGAGDPPCTGLVLRLVESFDKPIELPGFSLKIGVAVGISRFPDDGLDVDELLRKAHTACSQVDKSDGGVLRYHRDMFLQVVAQREREQALRDAIRLEQFVLYYQPQVDVRSGTLLGAEGLIRWQHPELGMIPPKRFLPLAEDLGLMKEIGQWVIEEGCRQLQLWCEAGLDFPHLSLNVAVSQFEAADFIPHLESVLTRYRVPAGKLCLEMVENVALDGGRSTLIKLQRLKELGVRLAIDDFGTGYSSLLYLRNYPFDIIKIDRSFIADCHETEEGGVILESIIQMGNKLKMPMVAEGVENADQLHFLFVHDCNAVQGYYFSIPLPPLQFERVVRQGFVDRRLLPEEFLEEEAVNGECYPDDLLDGECDGED